MTNNKNNLTQLKEYVSVRTKEIKTLVSYLLKKAKTNKKEVLAAIMAGVEIIGGVSAMTSCDDVPSDTVGIATVTNEHGDVITDEQGNAVTSIISNTTPANTQEIIDDLNSIRFEDLGITPTSFPKPDLSKKISQLTSQDLIDYALYTIANSESAKKIAWETEIIDFQGKYKEMNDLGSAFVQNMNNAYIVLSTILWDTPYRDRLIVKGTFEGTLGESATGNLSIENSITDTDIAQYTMAVEKCTEIIKSSGADKASTEKEKANILLKELMKICKFKAIDREILWGTNYKNNNYDTLINKDDIIHTTAYGALVIGEADSYGFTAAYNLLLHSVGIQAYPLLPERSNNHYVATGAILDGVPYQIDSTSADVTGIVEENFKGLIGYTIEDIEIPDLNFKSKHKYMENLQEIYLNNLNAIKTQEITK